MSVKLLTEHHLEFLTLKGGCTGLSESTLVKMQHCLKSHVEAHYIFWASTQDFGTYCISFNTPGRGQSKTPILSRNVDQKSVETLFLSIFDPRLSIVDNIFDFRLPGVFKSLLSTPVQLSSGDRGLECNLALRL